MPRQLRDLSTYICVLAVPPNVPEIIAKYKKDLCDDFANQHNGHTDDCADCENTALQEIQAVFIIHGKKCCDFGLPTPPAKIQIAPTKLYNTQQEKDNTKIMLTTLNTQQKTAYDKVIFIRRQ